MTKLEFARQIFDELGKLPDAESSHLDDWNEATFWGFVYFDGREAWRDRKIVTRLSHQIRNCVRRLGKASAEYSTGLETHAPEPQYSTERNARGRKQFERYEHNSFSVRLTIYG